MDKELGTTTAAEPTQVSGTLPATEQADAAQSLSIMGDSGRLDRAPKFAMAHDSLESEPSRERVTILPSANQYPQLCDFCTRLINKLSDPHVLGYCVNTPRYLLAHRYPHRREFRLEICPPSYSTSQSAAQGCHLCQLVWKHSDIAIRQTSMEEAQRIGLDALLSDRSELTFEDVRCCTLEFESDGNPTVPGGITQIIWCPRATQRFHDWAGSQYEARYLLHRLSVSFGVRVPYGHLPHFALCQLNRHPDLRLCQEWIDTCVSSHATCGAKAAQSLPTRVLDVGADCSDHSPVQLVETKGRKGMYVALSHSWGNLRTLTTTSRNYGEHREGINFRALPKTLRDTVTVVRKLNMRYLWIDSLCIVQDQPDDWQRECARMSSVFECAYLTIAAMDAPDTEAGLNHERTFAEADVLELPARNGSGNVVGTLFLTVLPRQPDSADGTESLKSLVLRQRQDLHGDYAFGFSHLDTRGWALQERILSHRVIYFRAQTLAWRCRAGDRVEGHKHQSKTRHYDSTAPFPSINATDIQLHEWWCNMLEGYSQRDLTYVKDVLPAICGLASRLQKQSGDVYIAGLWRRHLIKGLMWQTTQNVRSSRSASAQQPLHKPPSWSWVSARSLHHQSIHWDIFSGDTKEQLEVLSCHAEPVGHDPFGEVASGASLRVKGRARSCQVGKMAKELFGWFVSCKHMVKPLVVASFRPDFPDQEEILLRQQELSQSLLLLLLCDRHLEDIYIDWWALVLAPVGAMGGGYRRIGLAAGRMLDRGHLWMAEWDIEHLFDECEAREYTLV